MTTTQDAQPETACGCYSPIADYAIIGDCRTAALVSRTGSVDWLCLPRIDSPSIFAAILDDARGGRFRITPCADDAETTRRYLPQSNVLETTFRTRDGAARLTDCFAIAGERQKRQDLGPDHELLRVIEGVEGAVEIDILFDPRPDYSRRSPRLVRCHHVSGWIVSAGRQACLLRSEVGLDRRPDDPGLHARVAVHEGESFCLSLTYTSMSPQIAMPMGEMAVERMHRTDDWWREWSAQCAYEGAYHADVIRSALTLKLLAYAPSGAIVAAPTTSLPEHIGGSRNWDYRFCWLRDASMTIRALLDLGFETEGRAFLSWLMEATRLSRPELKILYDVHGESDRREHELHFLEGYRGSRPVRIGNAAVEQLQLDTYGALMDAAYDFAQRGGELGRTTSRLLIGFADVACRKWKEKDAGIWEVRGGDQHHTLSKVMCWVTVDRILRLEEQKKLTLSPKQRDHFQRVWSEIEETVEARGFNPAMECYTATLDGDTLDASLLLMPLYHYVAASHPRMAATVDAIHEHLGHHCLIFRYRADETPDGQEHGEAAFALCTFWYVQCLARMGRLDDARSLFEHMCAYSNDVGLFAEEVDAASGLLLGNFPQAYTHIGLINAAHTIALAERGELHGDPGRLGHRREEEAAKPALKEEGAV